MGAHGWTYFVVLVVLFVSLSGKRIRKPKIMSEGKPVVVNMYNNACSLGRIKKIETALTQIKKKLESLDNKITSLVSSSGSRSKLLHDFCLSFFFSIRKVGLRSFRQRVSSTTSLILKSIRQRLMSELCCSSHSLALQQSNKVR